MISFSFTTQKFFFDKRLTTQKIDEKLYNLLPKIEKKNTIIRRSIYQLTTFLYTNISARYSP